MSEPSMRHRSHGLHTANGENGQLAFHDRENNKPRPGRLIPSASWLLIFTFYAFTMWLVHFESHRFPAPKFDHKTPLDQFSEERARRHLDAITQMGARPVGSYQNEIQAVEYLVKELENIKEHSLAMHVIDIDVMNVTGSFSIDFLSGFTSYYDNVNNLLVKIGPRNPTGHSLLVNCHYDTTMDSPGASDDAVSCCSMLESIRALSQQHKPLKHSIIFNFNGAEENVLQASHGFITQHPWAESIRAFVNLEAAGAGGKELVFQMGPENPWLIYAYTESAHYPFASVIGQEVFQLGLIPSDTDFRIYRDFGNIPGMDIAYISNGYVYHSTFDTPEFIPSGCMQRGGENLLAILQNLGSSPFLAHPDEYRQGDVVFFDVIGLFMVVYPQRLGNIINLVTVALAIFGFITKIKQSGRTGFSGVEHVQYLCGAVVCHILTWVVVMATALLLAGFLTVCHQPMSWYTHNWLVIGLYVCPCLFAAISLHAFIKDHFWKGQDPWVLEHLFFDANQLIWAILLAFGTYKGVSSAYVAMLTVLFPLAIRDRLPRTLNIKFKDNKAAFFGCQFSSLFIPTLLTAYPLYGVMVLFMPIMGRIGTEVVPDIPIGGATGFGVVVCIGYQVGLMYVTKDLRRVQRVLAAVSVISFLLVLFTPLGFPYSGDPSSPSPQRHIFHHMDRKFNDINGQTIKSDSGILLIPFDYNGISKLPINDIPGLSTATMVECEDKPYCGLPYYFPMITLMKDVLFIPGPKLNPKPEVKLLNTERQHLKFGVQRLFFTLTGPSHINAYVTPRAGVTLTHWSLGNGVPMPCDMPPEVSRKTYFIFYSYGGTPGKPWEFSIDLQVPDDHDMPGIVDVGFGGHYTHGSYKSSLFVEQFVSKFPNWTMPIGWSATYESWEL